MIDGKTQLVGLIGWPAAHSLSPLMHNAAFDALGLNWRYVPLPVPPEQVEVSVRGLAAMGFRGVNVTVPHKQVVIPLLDSVAPDASQLGAVNTLVIDRDHSGRATISGHNTDHRGFVTSLRQSGFDPKGKRAVVVGAGGGGRAVVFGLLEAATEEIVVLDSALEQAQALVDDLCRQRSCRLRTRPLTQETLIESTHAADLFVHATPVGMWPHSEGCIWPEKLPFPAHLTAFDLVYNPLETHLLRHAREAGARTIDGLGMLVAQGALSFELWTGETAPIEVMRAAGKRALQERSCQECP